MSDESYNITLLRMTGEYSQELTVLNKYICVEGGYMYKYLQVFAFRVIPPHLNGTGI